jgi:hypothetical protein
MRFYVFTPIRQSLNGHFQKGNQRLSFSHSTVRAIRGSSEAHIRLLQSDRKFGPSKERDDPH